MEKEKKTMNKQKILIIVLIVALVAVIGVLAATLLMQESDDGPSRTAVIETHDDEPLNDTSSGQIRIKINPSVIIKDDTMQNLNFCNYNEGRLLQCKIRVGDEYVYDSGKLKEGQVVVGDFVEVKNLKAGNNDAIGEIYSYSTDETMTDPIGQTNVEMVLILQN